MNNSITDIKRNDNNFKFVDTLGEFINNIQFKNGYNEYLLGKNNQYSFLWNTLSAIGEEYADIIYDNVLNYLDNVSNVDLCKIKALQSMINIVGLKYDVLDSFKTIPIELANLMDILSINRSYILQSSKFSETFISLLSTEGVIKHSNLEGKTQLSSEISANYNAAIYNDYIDEDEYKKFLLKIYQFILNKYVKLQYADAENNLASEYQFIYEYIQNDILSEQNPSNTSDLGDYQKKMSQLKIKYGINKSFNPSIIVDNIENGYDSIENYNIYEKEILKEEISYREQTYSYIKKYRTSEEKFLGYNLTRYSYYREKKVKEYFSYIENTYNNMIIESNIRSIIDNTSNDEILVYDKDHNYFNIKQDNRETLLKYDPATKKVHLQTNQINAIAQLLVEQTLEIADIRDQIKIQIRKSYMRGTFLLISYVINEFLKYGIQKKYGDYFSTDEGLTLGDILSASFNIDNVQLIEYYDNTEYFNITTPYDVSAFNSETVNDKFWDNFYNKIGVNTQDIPLDEIENFYLNQLKLKHNKVDDVVNFLSIIYEYGANNSFIGRKNGEFTCKLNDGRLIGDPYREISDIKSEILSIETINDAIDTYVERGYVLSVTEISSQISTLEDFVSSYYWTEISNANEALKEETFAEYEKNLDSFKTIADSLNEISVRYDELKDNSKYKYYIDGYIEPTDPKPFFIEKVQNFIASCDYEFIWTNVDLSLDLTSLLAKYNKLSGDLYNRLFTLSVWTQGTSHGNRYDYWPYYSPKYDDELTTVTNALKDFLVGQAQVQNENAMQHVQNHYDKLLGYKNEINRILEDCNTADSKYNAYKTAVEVAIGYSFNDVIPTPSIPGCTCPQAWPVWGDPVFKIKVEDIKVDTDDGGYYHDISYITTDNLVGFIIDQIPFSNAPTIDEDSDTIEEKLEKIKQRCNYTTYASYQQRNNALVAVGTKHGWEHPEIAPYTYHTAKTVKNKEYTGDDENGQPEYEYVYDYYYIPHYEVTDGIAYDSNSKQKPWQEHYSQDVHDDILRLLNNAVANLTATIELINSELQCIGYQNIILQSNTTIDNVRTNTKNAYSQLISRIDDFDNIIQAGNEPFGWPSLNSDHNLDPFRQRLDRIKAINLSTASAYNISWINNEFNKINLSVQQLMLDDPDYFENYSHNAADRLDNQIASISNYMIMQDKKSKEEVSAAISGVSADYNAQLIEFDAQMPMVKRDIVESIQDNYAYNVNYILYSDEIYSGISDYTPHPPYPPIVRYKNCLDYLLSGNYLDIGYDKNEQLSGILNWIEICAYNGFEDTASLAIHNKIPQLKDYIDMMNLIDIAEQKYLYDALLETTLITDKLNEIISGLNYDISYISSQIPHYMTQKEIYLKYNGTQIGYDPFYNYKNLAYSSYQIHPYLYNFVEKSNLIYPLANNFFVSFTETYEKDLYKKTIDNIIGKYGNVKDLWRSGMFDWTSYQSLYEKRGSLLSETTKNPIAGFTGLFYQPALEAFLEDPNTFMQNTQDDVVSSYYHHLNLGVDASNKIVDQLTAYYNAIKTLVQYKSQTASLSNEYDIYKYAEDVNGNSLFLLKSYKHLYVEHANEENYVPSYNEKKNTLGELWMRIKDHPLAFPAFDIRAGNEDISQYNIIENQISKGKPLNQYIYDISEYFSNCNDIIQNYTCDLVSSTDTWARQKQYLKCFFDFELSPSNRSILLNVPYKTGTNSRKIMLENPKHKISDIKQFRYANSSILVAYLEYGGIDNFGIHIYNFTSQYTTTDDINVNIDNIANPAMLIGNNLVTSIDTTNANSSNFYEFVGFATNTQYIYSIFVQKHGYMPIQTYNSNILYHSFKVINKNAYIPYLSLRVVAYRLGSRLITSTIASDALKYDIYNAYRDYNIKQDDVKSYINAANVVLAANNTGITLAFLTERISPTKNNKYLNTSTIVNFSEYSTMIEKYTVVDESGIDKNYPTSTALIQTTDSNRINIYNSFDSFVQHLVNVSFDYNGNRLRYKNTKYFNLNSDLGYLPQYPDTFGKNNLFNNISLSSKNEYAIELLGPEKSDIPFTPIIKDNADEKYGRVVEDYKEYNKIIGYSSELSVLKHTNTCTYTFNLSSIFPEDEWNTLTATPDLLRYKYILYNTKYEARPILKGNLSDDIPNGYYYQWEEKYDLLSGEELIGPNQMSYQNVAMTNHIDNISALPLCVEFDTNTLLPINVHLSCLVRTVVDFDQIIPANTFRLMIYAKNNVKSYEYYHLFENASKNAIHNTITYDEEWRINFNEISSLSNYIIPDTDKKPFENKSADVSNASKLSAMLEFKYSEDEIINREFPYLDASDVEDEIIILQNDTQSIYYTALDNNKSIDRDVIKLETYNPSNDRYSERKLITSLPKYDDFYDRALRIETTYNLEKINADDPNSNYEIVMYFNYKNFTNPSYIKFIKNNNQPPTSNIYNSIDEEIQNTYLVLKPGESGKLDIRIDYIYYAKINPFDISESICGCYSQILKTYYIINVSDNKPKFIISRTPFKENQSYILETDNYELKDSYQIGMPFRYIMFIILSTRMHPITTSSNNSIVAIGKLKFKTKDDKYFNYPSNTTAYISGAGATIIQPNVPTRMLDDNEQHYFSASNCDFDASPLSIVIDLHEQILDIQQYKYWEWYNSPYSNSHSGYMPDEFKIAFSNDKHRWYLGDSIDDVQKILPTINYRKAYPYGNWTGELNINE